MKKLLVCMTPLWSLGLYTAVEKSLVEKPIVVIIPSYNNEKYIEKNLNSVYDQEYDNYRVVYVDDNSKDKTLKRAEEIVALRGQEHRTTIIHNDHNCGAMANFYHTIHEYCDTWDIVVQLDGDDWLKHNRVLARLNQEYSDHDVWMTYGRCEYYPEGKPDGQKRLPAKIVARSAYREYEKVPSHLRTFYAGLFKNIALQDFLYQGAFLKMNCDLAAMFPLLEMANGKVGFIDEIVHVYNCATPINDYKKDILLQLHLDHVLRSRDKYKPLATFDTPAPHFEPDVFIIDHRDEEVSYCKADLMQNIQGLGSIKTLSVCAQTTDFFEQLEKSSADFIFIVDSRYCCKKPFDITLCTKMLEQTKAQVFCCDLGVNEVGNRHNRRKPVPPLVLVAQDTYGWHYALAEGLWREPFGNRAHIYTKKTLKQALSRACEWHMIDPFACLNGTLFDYASVGLCGKEPFLGESDESLIRFAKKIEENF